MSAQEEIGRPSTPKAVQVDFTFQTNPYHNNPLNAPRHHHILPANQLYFPQWVRNFAADGCASETFCVPIGHGNSLGIKESLRRWNIEQLFHEGQSDPEGLGPIRAQLLNQMLKGSVLASLPPYGSLPYWQSTDAPDVSFDVAKAANLYTFTMKTKAPKAPKRQKHTSSSTKYSKALHTKLPVAASEGVPSMMPQPLPSRYSPGRPAPPPPSHKGEGKGSSTQTVATSHKHPVNATTEINPNDPWSRVTSSQTFDDIIKGMKNNSISSDEAPPTNRRIAHQASSNRRLQRSRAHVQTHIDDRGFAPEHTNDPNLRIAPPSTLASGENESTDDYDDDEWYEKYHEDDGETPARPPITGRVVELDD